MALEAPGGRGTCQVVIGAEDTRAQRAELVLLPEFACVEPFWESREFDAALGASVTATTDAWIERLNELDVAYVGGTRPASQYGLHFNEGFLWSRARHCRPRPVC